jgi:hypothetical protein
VGGVVVVIERTKAGWADLKLRYQTLLTEYGYGAFGVWFTVFFATWFGFYVAIQNGMNLEGAAASAGTIGGAYVATQATKPIRLVITLVLTPVIVGGWRKFRGHPPVSDSGEASVETAEAPSSVV